MTVTRYVPIVAIAVGVAACATATSGATARQQGCALGPGDTVYLRGGPVYRECAVDQRAKSIDRSAEPEIELSSPPPNGQACYSAEIEFVVDEHGVPETATATVLRSNDENFARATVRAIANWRYKPALLHGYPVRQIVREQEKIGVAVAAAPVGDAPRMPRAPAC